MIRQSFINCKIELIENFPCNNAEELRRFDELIIGNEHDDFLDPSKWEVIDKIGNKYNRFAMWDASLIHAATSYFGKSKESGRLFHMFFFNAM